MTSLTAAAVLQPWIAQQYAELASAMTDFSDPENVHIARVRCRRLRSVLGGWRSILPPHAPKMRSRLQHLGRQISHLRDIDVIADLISLDPPSDLPDWRQRIAQQRTPLLDEATLVAHSANTRALLRDVRELAVSDWGLAGHQPAADIAGAVLDAEKARLAEVKATATDPHEVRKAAKRLRYNAEVAAVVLPEATEVAVAAEAIQERLGADLDHQMVAAWLSEARASG